MIFYFMKSFIEYATKAMETARVAKRAGALPQAFPFLVIIKIMKLWGRMELYRVRHKSIGDCAALVHRERERCYTCLPIGGHLDQLMKASAASPWQPVIIFM